MTIEEFKNKYHKKIETVLKWIYEGWIPKASIDRNYIPDSARIPYKSRAKNAGSIYKGIIEESKKLKHVSAKSFKLTEEEFKVYINQLEKDGLICKRISDEIEYYDATKKAIDLPKKELLDTIKGLACAVSCGVVKGIL